MLKMNKFFYLLLVMLSMIMSTVSHKALAAESEIVVFAAASTTNAINEIADNYATQKLGKITSSFASSSTLAKQIESGAPADIFLSANPEWMDYLEQKKLIQKNTRKDILGNKIVLIVPQASKHNNLDIKSKNVLIDILGKDGRFATGDPEHVPAGMYGKKALEHLGVWDQVKDHLAPTKDVRAALTLVEQGEAPLGLIYSSDAVVSSKVRVLMVLPENSYPAIAYPIAITTKAKTAEAQKFIDFLQSAESKKIFEKYGFAIK